MAAESRGWPPWWRLNVGGPAFCDVLSYSDFRDLSWLDGLDDRGLEGFFCVCGEDEAGACCQMKIPGHPPYRFLLTDEKIGGRRVEVLEGAVQLQWLAALLAEHLGDAARTTVAVIAGRGREYSRKMEHGHATGSNISMKYGGGNGRLE